MKKLTWLLLISLLCISILNVYGLDFLEGTNKTTLVIEEGASFYIQFNPIESFDSLDLYIVNMGSADEAYIYLYEWTSNFNKLGDPLASSRIIGSKNSYFSFNFTEKEAREYLVKIEAKKGNISLQKANRKKTKVNLYLDTYPETGSINMKLNYVNVVTDELGPLSEYEYIMQSPPPEQLEKSQLTETIRPDTWTGVDGLLRTLPLYDSVGPIREGKKVGIFYWTWHGSHAKASRARNIHEIIKEFPEATNDFKHRAWENYSGYHHWNEPLFGYYSTNDLYVLRKHAEMLADAGIDFIAFDCTNGSYTWTESYMNLLKVFKAAKDDGINVPKITFMSNFAPFPSSLELMETLYKELYKPSLYSDLWFYLDGKPLMWAFPDVIPTDTLMGEEMLNFFSFRYPYAEGIWPHDDTYSWGWAGLYPNKGHGVGKTGKYEEISISIAVNAKGPMNNPDALGRGHSLSNYQSSYTYGNKTIIVNSKMEDRIKHGIFIQEQWDYSIKEDPDIIFVCGWNEWVAIRHEEWGGYENAFPDQFNDEFSRDIEPSKGDLLDHYYYQLVANVRRFKGVSKPQTYMKMNTIDIHGDISQWDKVEASFNHYTNNTYDRDHPGYIGTYYKSSTMRNDIKNTKVAFDKDNIYFYVETVDPLTDPSGSGWMRLFIDTCQDGTKDSFEGFEYIVNREKVGIVERSKSGFDWEVVCSADYKIYNNSLQIVIPREGLGLSKGTPAFSFKWTDNILVEDDILLLYTDGDCAPCGRFAFAFNVGNKEESKYFYYVLCFSLVLVFVKRKKKGY